MIEYVKMILLKVSFEGVLFEKELIKGSGMLKNEELLPLKYWCYAKFAEMHPAALTMGFADVQE